MASSKPLEHELGHNQRGLVDNIVEENQYQAAIDTLFQLRSPQYKPHPSHIRQLIFLALHSHVSLSSNKTRGVKTRSSITPKAATSALDLLSSLLATNSPESLGRALPSYATQDPNLPSAYVHDQSDSLLAKQALSIQTAKHCWELLEEGYIYRTQVLTSPKGKSKLRRDYSIEESLQNETMAAASHLVGADAWPFLEWLVSLFERDEQFQEQSQSAYYSPILLEQLPPPRGDSVTRWDFADILNIVVHCLEQADSRRHRLGYRLMALLINLTSTIHADISTLVTSAYRRLLVAGRSKFFDSLLSNLPSSTSVWTFKVLFCLKLATDGTSSLDAASQTRPRPQARTAPKPRPLGGPESPKKPLKARTEVPKQSLPDVTELLQALERPIPDILPDPLTKSLILLAKFELVLSFASAQNTNMADKRLEWDRLIQDGRLTESMNIGFATASGEGNAGSMYLQMLREFLRLGV